MTMTVIPTTRLIPGLIEPVGGKQTLPGVAPGVGVGAPKFTDLLNEFVNSVNQAGQESGQAQQALLAGEPVELHQVMIKAEEAGLSMDLLLEIRNKLLAAYKDIIRMPM